ncbi:hypothetical protein [Nocardia sp. CY41]|uniref:hypothetical protein n=1 Tax=Nocardia sp. CY41 TaxID=2608686 RepID=UPI00135965E5|nr:hypothetical protein [Nocardia sp. CY41]
MRSEWQPWKLGEAGTEIRSRNSEFVALIDETVTQIRAAGAHWSGDAYYAAYDRIAGDRDAANKVALDTDDLAQTLIDSGTSLAGFRQALLDKVDEAVAAGFTVSEDWQVIPGPDVSDDDGDTQYTHQTAITTALNELLGTQSDVATKIEQAGANVRTRSEQLGEGDPLDGTPQTDPMLAVYSRQSDTGETEQVPTDPSTTPAGTPQASPIAGQQPAGQDGADQATKQDGADQSAKQEGADQSAKQEGADQSGKKQDDAKTDDTGAGKDETKTDQPAQTPASTGAASDPNSWKPSDVTSLITAVGTITGNVPTLIESVGKLDDNLADIIKAGGEAGKGLIDSAGTAAEKFANAADTVITSADRAADGTPAAAPSTGDPTKTDTPAPTQPGADPATSQSATDPNAKSTDQKPDNSAADAPSSPSTAPAGTGLLGAPVAAANRESDSEHTRRVQATPTCSS